MLKKENKAIFTLFVILNIAVSIVYSVFNNCILIRYVCVLQQNYYRPKKVIKWLFDYNNIYFKNLYINTLLLSLVFVVISAIFVILKVSYGFYYILHLFCITYLIVLNMTISEISFKKPLIYTKRVIRLLITNALINAIMYGIILVFSIKYNFVFCLLSIPLYLCPFTLIFSNFVNSPLELFINFTYVVKAKNKLKKYKNLKVIAITGSYGKTSTKNYLYSILAKRYNVVSSPASYNTSTGITRTILEYLKPYHDILILEMGADKNNDIDKLCKIVKPDISIITAVGNQHLETFKTIDNIINTKFQLVKNTSDNGFFVTNTTNDICKFYTQCSKIPYYAVGDNQDFCNIDDIKCSNNGMDINCHLDRQKLKLHTDIIGKFNAINILLGVVTAYELGVEIADIVDAVNSLQQVEHRLNTRMLPKGATLIDDSFNSNVEGFKGAVDTLQLFNTKKVIVTCGVVDLGDEQYTTNYELGRLLKDVEVYIVNKTNYNAIKNGVESVGGDTPKYFGSFKDCYNQVIANLDKNYTVLIENDLPDLYIIDD